MEILEGYDYSKYELYEGLNRHYKITNPQIQRYDFVIWGFCICEIYFIDVNWFLMLLCGTFIKLNIFIISKFYLMRCANKN